MGEIGIPDHDAMYILDMCRIRHIIKGYRRRCRVHYDNTRWLMWSLNCMLGGEAQNPREFFPFEWEKKPFTEEDEAELLKMVQEAQEYNKNTGNN